jgi:RNA polymerase sigma-70 factor, ECF subfamily
MDQPATPEQEAAAAFAAHRPALVGLAYRMTGSLAQAEDIAQDAFLRWRAAPRGEIVSPRAWLLKATARLALDQLTSARARREVYVGPWLPEPALEALEAPQQAALSHRQQVSVAMLLALRRLTPAERAVFILHDLFDIPFQEIATLLRRTEPACRKLATRAREHLREDEPRATIGEEEAARIAAAFHAASAVGDLDTLRAMLAADAVIHTDGGGVRPAALRPILGAEKALRFLAGIARKRPAPPALLHAGRLNGLPGFITLEADGLPQATTLELRDGAIAAIYIVRNPRKLGGILRRFPPHGPATPHA